MHQHRIIEDTVYFGAGSNDTSGSGNDGVSAVFDVRLAGAAAGAAPVLSGSATLLTHANFPPGCYEIAIAATTGNGFAAGNTYLVFFTVLADSQNPTGFMGSFSLEPIIADVRELAGAVQSLTDLKDFADAGYDPGTNKVEGVKLVDTCTTNTDQAGTDNAALASGLAAHDSKLDTAQTDLDTLTGADGATLATAQGNYAPAKAGDQMNLVADQSAATVGTVTDVSNDVGITQAGADKVNGSGGAVIPDIDIGAPPSTPTPQQYRSTVWASLVNKAISDTSGAGEWKIFSASGTLAAKGTITDGSSIFTRSRLGAPS